MSLTLSDVVKATRGRLMSGTGDIRLAGLSTDTRTLRRGDFFVALRGPRHDGHDHVAHAYEKGAAGAMVERVCGSFPRQVVVKDTLRGLGLVARHWRRRFPIPVVAVTGSNGKTTTKDMTASILSQRYRVLKTEGNLNNWIGLPQTLLRLSEGIDIAVVEMGMNHKGEIDWLSRMAEPETGLITHVGRAHIENFRSRRGIASAKGELLKRLPRGGHAILNADDPFTALFRKTVRARGAREQTFGFGRSTAQIMSVTAGLSHTRFCLKIAGRLHRFEMNLSGRHNVSNAAAAILAGRLYGVSFPKIRAALRDYQPEKKRMEVFHLARGVDVVGDVYNANPDSVMAAIDYLKSFRGRRRVLVLGDMLELGKEAPALHREVGAAAAGVDSVVAVGAQASHIASGAREAGVKEVVTFDSVEAALPVFPQRILAGDLVLIKGSRGMKMERLTECLSTQPMGNFRSPRSKEEA